MGSLAIAEPSHLLCQERAEPGKGLSGWESGAGAPYPWLCLNERRSCDTEFMEGSFQGCAWGSGVLGVSSSRSKAGAWVRVEKHREEVRVSCLDQSWLSLL